MWLLSRLTSGHAARRVVVNCSHAGVNDAGFGPRGNVHTWTWSVATRYAPRAEPVFFPLDEELELLPGELSATLAEGVARVGTKRRSNRRSPKWRSSGASSWRKPPFGDTRRRLAPPTWRSRPPNWSAWSVSDRQHQ